MEFLRSTANSSAIFPRNENKKAWCIKNICVRRILHFKLENHVRRFFESTDHRAQDVTKVKSDDSVKEMLKIQISSTQVIKGKTQIKIMEHRNKAITYNPPLTKLSPLVDDDVGEEEAIEINTKLVNTNNEEHESIEVDIIVNIKEPKNHPIEQVIAPKAWYDRLKAFLIKHEYSIGMVDHTLFTKKSKSHLIIVQIYVDDIIFGSTSQNLYDDFVKIMHDEFEMSMMGKLNFFLGLQIKQMEDGIFFNQSKYIKEMLKKFGLEDSKPTKTPMSMEIKLTKDDEADSVDSSKYRGMIGSLLYLTASRPDIMFSVCLCALFQENPKTTHLEAVKHIFRYIRGTSHLGLWYPKGTGIEIVVYANSDHAGNYVDRKSTSGICTFIGCCLTSWFGKKQTALAISTTEAEYVSTKKACQQALWMKQALIDYEIRLDDVLIMCDNKGAIDLSKNPVQHSRTKHIEICQPFLRDNVQKGNIFIEKVASEDNIADIFTKPLKSEVFNYLRLGLGMMELIMDSDSPSSQK
ncbi:retrovirus-related pol polyprotein from transposon TNT 1-94 [Tanacetum coccineum]